jgi:hypothetical protein
MNLRVKWWQLDEICRLAKLLPDVEVWVFGSALCNEKPADLDVLLVYDDRASVLEIRSVRSWADTYPPCDIIAMTRAEEREYRFIDGTGAVKLA